jgi:hypothetical protein
MVMPLTHAAYECTVEMTVPPGVIGGATVFYEAHGYGAAGLKDGLVRPYTRKVRSLGGCYCSAISSGIKSTSYLRLLPG